MVMGKEIEGTLWQEKEEEKEKIREEIYASLEKNDAFTKVSS